MSNIVKYVKWFLSRVRDQVVIQTAVLSDHTWPDLPHYRKQEIILSAYLFSWTEYSGQQTTKNDWNRFACEGSRKPNLWRFWDTQIMTQFPAAQLHLVFPVSSDLVWISSRFLAPKPRFPSWATMQRDLRFSSFDIGPSTDLWQTDRQTEWRTPRQHATQAQLARWTRVDFISRCTRQHLTTWAPAMRPRNADGAGDDDVVRVSRCPWWLRASASVRTSGISAPR